MEAKCYKVVGCDPEDGIIINSSSLKMGISQKIIEEANKYTTDKFKFDDYFHILNKDEGSNMMKQIKLLIELYKKMQIRKNNYIPSSKHDDICSSKDIEENKAMTGPPVMHQSSRNDNVKNIYKIDDSLAQQLNENFKTMNPNASVIVEKQLDDSLNKGPTGEYLETFQDVDIDDNFL